MLGAEASRPVVCGFSAAAKVSQPCGATATRGVQRPPRPGKRSHPPSWPAFWFSQRLERRRRAWQARRLRVASSAHDRPSQQFGCGQPLGHVVSAVGRRLERRRPHGLGCALESRVGKRRGSSFISTERTPISGMRVGTMGPATSKWLVRARSSSRAMHSCRRASAAPGQ